jgi:rhomboid protease GluP
MAETEMNALEGVLRLCAAQAPGPWFPRLYVRQTGVSKEDISEVIEHLLLEGLLQRAPGDETTGPGLVLTTKGKKALTDPASLERLRQGLTLAQGERGGVVREALERNDRPYVTRILIAINVLVFLYGTYLAATHDDLQTFLTGLSRGDNPKEYEAGIRRHYEVTEADGSVTAESWLRGEWWRLVTSCFAHHGLLHLFMNMYMLWVSGAFLERVWGRARFLLIYLISGVVGAGVGLAHNTTILVLDHLQPPVEVSVPLAGASTSLCGILAAEAIWVWLNGRYLPRTLQNRWRNNLMIQTVLIVFISFFPGVSGWGHFGGAVAGALTALVLNYQRFGPSPWRWAALGALVPIALLGYGEIYRMRTNRQRLVALGIALSDRGWKNVEETDYDKRFKPSLSTEMTEVDRKAHRDRVERLLDMDPARREELKAKEVQQALDFLAYARNKWAGYLTVVDAAGPYYQPEVVEMRDDDRTAIAAHLKLFELEEKCLRAGKQWTPEEESALREQRQLVKEAKFKKESTETPAAAEIKPAVKSDRAAFKQKFLDKLIDCGNSMSDVWDKVQYELVKPPKDRVDKLVAAAVKKGQEQRRKMNDLAEQLDAAGASKDEEVERLRTAALDAQRAGVQLLDLADRCLRDGQQWNGKTEYEQERKKRQKMIEALRELGWVE